MRASQRNNHLKRRSFAMQYGTLVGNAFRRLSHPGFPVLLLVAVLSERYLRNYLGGLTGAIIWPNVIIAVCLERILLFLLWASVFLSSAYTLNDLRSHSQAWGIGWFLIIGCSVLGLVILPSVLPPPDTVFIYGFAARMKRIADIPSIRRWAQEKSFPETGVVTVRMEDWPLSITSWPPSTTGLGVPSYYFEVVNREIRLEFGGGFAQRCGLVISVDDTLTTNSLNRYPVQIEKKMVRYLQPGVYVWYELINPEHG